MNASNLLRAALVCALTVPSAGWAQDEGTPPIESSPPPPAPAPAPARASTPEPAAQTSSRYGVADKKETFGAVMAPAALPGGSNAAYVYIGVQNIGAGYRQGVGVFELEGRTNFNYLLISMGV